MRDELLAARRACAAADGATKVGAGLGGFLVWGLWWWGLGYKRGMLHRNARARLLALLLVTGCQAPAPPGANDQQHEGDGLRAQGTAELADGDLAQLREGFVGVRLGGSEADGQDSRVFLRFEEGQSFVYFVALTAGLGSNDVGLDRGKLAPERVLEVRREGRRLLLVAPNLAYRAASAEPAIQRAVREAFAESVVASFDIITEQADGGLVVDASEFAARDAHGITEALERAGEGSFALESGRTYPIRATGFADNSFVDVRQTFAGSNPGSEVRSTTPEPEAITLTIRHHFVRLPDQPMPTRHADPRSGFFTADWRQLDRSPVDDDRVQVIARHRLPADGSPITYYLDSGAPEPMRSALLRGARYWEAAFAEAGLPGRFRVELLPEGADPHDARFHVIQWVFRSTRGWSYGNSIVDPRTGEILKGHVSLGALRVRQDVKLIEALLSPYGDESGDPRVMEVALARLSQLAAHEVGHTLGLRHHFAASTSGRASVMDYPSPRVTLGPDGAVLVDDAYRAGTGEWDALAIRYGYGEFESQPGESAAQSQARGLAAVLEEMESRGLWLHSDRDASAGIHPAAHRWDDGEDPASELRASLALRRAALERFGAENLPQGRALADLELTLAPLYFWHRYQVDAAAALVGGRRFHHEVRGASPPAGIQPLEPSLQRAGFEALLESLAPATLAVPAHVRSLLVPPPPGRGGDRERFEPNAGLFDPLHAARAAAQLVLQPLLDRDRLIRVAVQAGEDPEQFDLEELFLGLVDLGWGAAPAGEELLQRELRGVLLGELLTLLTDPELPVSVGEPLAAALKVSVPEQEVRVGLPLDRFERLLAARLLSMDPERRDSASPPARLVPGPPIGCCGAADGWLGSAQFPSHAGHFRWVGP